MSKDQALHVKAKAVLRELGHADGEPHREYKDWHIEIRGGLNFVSVWTSSGMVFLSLANKAVFHRPGPWEEYLDRLFHRPNRTRSNDRVSLPGISRDWPVESAGPRSPSEHS
jgi:hypothetical protein